MIELSITPDGTLISFEEADIERRFRGVSTFTTRGDTIFCVSPADALHPELEEIGGVPSAPYRWSRDGDRVDVEWKGFPLALLGIARRVANEQAELRKAA